MVNTDQYNRLQMIKSLIFMAVSFCLFHFLGAYYVPNPSLTSATMWEGIFYVLANVRFLAMQFWLSFFFMLYLTVGELTDYEVIYRSEHKREWLSREIVRLFVNCGVFCLCYLVMVLLFNLIVHGWPSTIGIGKAMLFDIPVNYSIGFILLLALLSRLFSSIAVALLYFLFYLEIKNRSLPAVILGIYSFFSVIALHFGVIFRSSLSKFLLFPSGIDYYFYTFGSIAGNFCAGIAFPLFLSVLVVVILLARIKKLEFL